MNKFQDRFQLGGGGPRDAGSLGEETQLVYFGLDGGGADGAGAMESEGSYRVFSRGPGRELGFVADDGVAGAGTLHTLPCTRRERTEGCCTDRAVPVAGHL